MEKELSCGILNFYKENNDIYVLLASAGGPYFKNKEIWSIPKGLMEKDEKEIDTAYREFIEETGIDIYKDNIKYLNKISQSNKKDVVCFYTEGKFDLSGFKSNYFTMEWPPKSGKIQEFPETKEIKYIEINKAKNIIIKGQIKLLEKLEEILGENK